MRHTFLKVLLTVGLVGGLIAGFAGCHHHGHYARHSEYWEQKVTGVCTTAVKDALADERRANPPPPPPSYPAAAPAPAPPPAPGAAAPAAP